MVLGWRRAFCTSTTLEEEEDLDYDHTISNNNNNNSSSITTPKLSSRFAFFTSSSNPSTPRLRSDHSISSPSLRCRTTASVPLTPNLHCETNNNYNSPKFFHGSPRSSSPFSFLKSSLRLHARRCGLCLHSVKKGQGTATFTAECSHIFHFPCISDHVKKQGSLACPLCKCLWKELPMLSVDDHEYNRNKRFDLGVDEDMVREKLATRFVDDVVGKKRKMLRSDLKVYNDDEPLASLTPKARFNPIPESDENCDEDSIEEFQGFYVTGDVNGDVDVRVLPETVVIAASRRHETYAVVLNVKAPAAPQKPQRRASIDLVAVIDVSGKITDQKLQVIKKAMRTIVLSLSSSDRLSIVAFASYSKRLLPLRRMTTSGRRAARRIIEAMAVLGGSSNSKDAVMKAVKVLEDRREKNHAATVILLTDDINQSTSVSSTRYSHSQLDIPIHSLNLGLPNDLLFAKCIANLLSIVVQNLRLELSFVSGKSQAVIAAVYSRTPHPTVLNSSSVGIGDLFAGEERELLVELKVPSSAIRSHQVLSVRCCYNDSLSQEIIYGKQQALLVPRPTTVRSSSTSIQRLRNIFISTRALAESRRLTERSDLIGAYHMLVSARVLLKQSNTAFDDECMLSLEAELSELRTRLKAETPAQRVAAYTDEKGEPLTPTSAWRVADKLAKVAMMRKSVNRVSDLHGFEDARF